MFFLVFVVLFLSVIFLKMINKYNHGELYSDENVQHYGFFILGYKKEYYYWDTVIWIRTIIVYSLYGIYAGSTEGSPEFVLLFTYILFIYFLSFVF